MEILAQPKCPESETVRPLGSLINTAALARCIDLRGLSAVFNGFLGHFRTACENPTKSNQIQPTIQANPSANPTKSNQRSKQIQPNPSKSNQIQPLHFFEKSNNPACGNVSGIPRSIYVVRPGMSLS